MDNILMNGGMLGNAGTKENGSSQSGMFIFNGYNLHNMKTRFVIQSDHDNLGTIAFETYDYPRTDGGNVLSKFYRSKTITIKMCLVSETDEGLNDLIDELKFRTSQTQGYLDIIINGIVRRRTATLVSLDFGRQSYNVNFLQNVELKFQCMNQTSFTLSSITNTFDGISGDYATEINYNGKVMTYPTIYANIVAENSLTSFSIDMNGYIFTINKSLLPGDLIQIDGETKLVKINGTTVAYSGPFPIIEPGLNHIEINLNSGALANYDVVFIYKNLYL